MGDECVHTCTLSSLYHSKTVFKESTSGTGKTKWDSKFLILPVQSFNITSYEDLFGNSQGVLAVFTGYLVGGSTSHDATWYVNEPSAYFCILGRAAAVLLCVLVITVSAFMGRCEDQLMSTKVVPEGQAGLTQSDVYEIVYTYFKHLEPINRIITVIAYLCTGVFIAGFWVGKQTTHLLQIV